MLVSQIPTIIHCRGLWGHTNDSQEVIPLAHPQALCQRTQRTSSEVSSIPHIPNQLMPEEHPRDVLCGGTGSQRRRGAVRGGDPPVDVTAE